MNQIVNSRPAVNKTYVELTDDAKKIYEMAQIMEDEGTKTLEQSMQEYIVLGGVLQKMKVHKDNRRKWDSSLTTIGLTSKFANKIISLYEYKDLEGMGTITTRQQGLDLIAVHTGKSSEPAKSEEQFESDESEKIEEVQHEDEEGSEEHIPSEKVKPAKVKGSHGPRRPKEDPIVMKAHSLLDDLKRSESLAKDEIKSLDLIYWTGQDKGWSVPKHRDQTPP